MKTNKKINTLALNKRTVSRLTASELIDARGGADLVVAETHDCVLIPIDITLPIATRACAPTGTLAKTVDVISKQIG